MRICGKVKTAQQGGRSIEREEDLIDGKFTVGSGEQVQAEKGTGDLDPDGGRSAVPVISIEFRIAYSFTGNFVIESSKWAI